MKNKNRFLSETAFSCLFAYLLSFVFEGQILYSLLDLYQMNSSYIFFPIVMHFLGLHLSGFFVRSFLMAKRTVLITGSISLVFTIPFFFSTSIVLWLIGLMISAFGMGFAVASWGFFLKAFIPQAEKIKSCANMLIFSNIAMIIINVVVSMFSPYIGLVLAITLLIIGILIVQHFPISEPLPIQDQTENKYHDDLKKALKMLFLFVTIITINSGLMYQILNPAFEHLSTLVSWYWAIPYIIAIAVMKNFSVVHKRSVVLYVAILMVMGAFICFMLMGRNAIDYIIIDTLILGACGILDLFWWSIIAHMLDYTRNPVKIFGFGLSANVFGVLCGGILGFGMRAVALPESHITVIALCVVCVTLAIIPLLNRRLTELLSKNDGLSVCSDSEMLPKHENTVVTNNIEKPSLLTDRENDVLTHLLSGKSNKEIATTLFISENTVKTHARNIYMKYNVTSRAELISTLLKEQKNA